MKTESCGCIWWPSAEFSAAKLELASSPMWPPTALGVYDDEPELWILVCELHSRYGWHREMAGYDRM